MFRHHHSQIGCRKEKGLISEKSCYPCEWHWPSMPAKFRKCIAFGNTVRVPSHDVLSLLKSSCAADWLPLVPCQSCSFIACFFANSTNLVLQTRQRACFKISVAGRDPRQILSPSKYNWQAPRPENQRKNRPQSFLLGKPTAQIPPPISPLLAKKQTC